MPAASGRDDGGFSRATGVFYRRVSGATGKPYGHLYAVESRSLHLAEATSRARLFAEVIKPAVSTPECRPPPPNTRTVSRVFVRSLEVNGSSARPGRGAPKPPLYRLLRPARPAIPLLSLFIYLSGTSRPELK